MESFPAADVRRVYGYDNVELLAPNGTRQSVTRQANREVARPAQDTIT